MSDIAFVTVAALIAAAVWAVLDRQRVNRVEDIFAVQAGLQVDLLQTHLDLQVLALGHLAELQVALAGTDPGKLESDARRHVEGARGLPVLRYPDADGARGMTLYAPGTAPEPMVLSPAQRQARARAGAQGLPVIAPAGDGRLLVFVPLRRGAAAMGTIDALYDPQGWTEAARFDANRMILHLDDAPVPAAAGDGNRLRLTRQIEVFRTPLSVTVSAPRPLTAGSAGYVPESLGALVLLILVLLWQSVRQYHQSYFGEMRAKAANARLRSVNDRLLVEIKERRLAEQRAEKSRLATSRFLATMSHEIRTPLNAIMGMFQLIAKSGVPERQKLQAANGLAAAERLFRELCNVLDVSQLDAGAMTVSAREVQSQPLMALWRALLEGMVHKSGKPLLIAFDASPDLPKTLLLDQLRLTQIVTNLMDNAVKFTDAGEVGVRIGFDSANATLEIRVRDTGPGIAESQRDSIFQRFYQVEDSLMRRLPGSGLGLSISRELAHLMNGRLELENRAPRGTVFSLVLSNVETPEARAVPVEQPAPAPVHEGV